MREDTRGISEATIDRVHPTARLHISALAFIDVDRMQNLIVRQHAAHDAKRRHDVRNQAIEWSSKNVPIGDLTDAWQSVLSSSYREWQIPRRLPATFFAHVKTHDFAGADIVETVCDPCSGQRMRAQLRHDDEPYIGVQLTTEGRERFKIGDSGIEVASGEGEASMISPGPPTRRALPSRATIHTSDVK